MDKACSLLFVSVEKPDGRPDKEQKQNVRSFVTRRQHARKRHRLKLELRIGKPPADAQDDTQLVLPHSRSSSSGSADSLVDDAAVSERKTPRGRRHPGEPATKRKPAKEQRCQAQTPCTVVCTTPQRPYSERFESTGRSPESADSATLTPMLTPHWRSPQTTPTTTLSHWQDYFTLPPSPGLEDPGDMFGAYAYELQTEPSALWSHYLWQEKEHGRIFRSTHGKFQGFAPRCLHPLILSHPAMLATTVLFTGCHMRFQRGEPIMSPVLHRVHSLAYKFVQAAIDSDLEQLSDATLLAVIKLALFEVIFGHWSAFRVHMQGIAQMVRLRNGLENLGMAGYTAYLLVWFDAQLTAVADMPHFLDFEAAIADIDTPEADPDGFALGVKPLGRLHSE